jgi:hypothetical protein
MNRRGRTRGRPAGPDATPATSGPVGDVTLPAGSGTPGDAVREGSEVGNVRRAYTYAVCAVALQGLTWALINLLRNLLLSPRRPQPEALAFQIAVIAVGGALYLGHWLPARRLARRHEEERQATVRGLYLYGMMAGFLAPLLPNLYDFVDTLLSPRGAALVRRQDLISPLIAVLVLGLFWLYHWLEARPAAGEEIDAWAAVRRLYLLGFAATGLGITTVGLIDLIRWLLDWPGANLSRSAIHGSLATLFARLLVGVPLWLVFWIRAQRLFRTGDESERDSTLRKVYLYLAVLIGSLGSIAAATALLAGLIRRLVRSIPRPGSSGDYREALSLIAGLGLLWAYHAVVIRRDAGQEAVTAKKATVRQVYAYLVAGAGLLALAYGLGGEITILVNALTASFSGSAAREAIVWPTAGAIAGLLVYAVQWRRAQVEARAAGPERAGALRSTPRRIYLYLSLFLAVLVDLGALILIVYRVLSLLLGGERLQIAELAQAIGYGAIGAAVWVGHLVVLRTDRRLLAAEESTRPLHLVVLNAADSPLGPALVRKLAQGVAGVQAVLVHVGGPGGVDDSPPAAQEDRLAGADLILVPWPLLQAGGGTPEALLRAVVDSPARKLLVPVGRPGWEWIGVDQPDAGWVEEAAHAVRRVVEGRPVKPQRPLGAAAIAWIVVGALVVLSVLAGLGVALFGIFR